MFLGFPMKRVKREDGENPDDWEILLPESIIQDIQSRLTRTEAAQTAVLSKSWYSAWSTRPYIDVDCNNVQPNAAAAAAAAADPDAPAPDPFPEYARQAMRRYDELNLKIDSFRLCMESDEGDLRLLAGELIAKAWNLGAKDMEIIFMSTCDKHGFTLQDELLVSESLARLTMTGCKIDRGADSRVNWPSLNFLCLFQACIEGDVLWDILVGCPLIETLFLRDCKFLTEYSIQNVTRYLDFGHYGFGTQRVVDDLIIPYVFSHLTCLIFSYVKLDSSFFYGFSSKFPSAKDLTLSHCLGPKKVHICSPSLEKIVIDQIILLRARIDAPNLRRFFLSSGHIPSISFGTVSGEWESHVSAGCSKFLDNSWFRLLKKFISAMSPSKFRLSLRLTPHRRDSFDLAETTIPGPILENLTVNMAVLEIHTFWNGLFWSCRPKFINSTWSSMYDMGALEVACRRLTNVGDNVYTANKHMFGQSNLEEANLEVFDETDAEWKPVAWKKLSDASTSREIKRKIRFHLRWSK